MAEDVIKI
jgi:hypothetical protein